MTPENKICKWYLVCPIKFFVDNGKLERKWIENFCLVGNKSCVRYQLEENGKPYPDNLLPNGEIKNDPS
ncbi:MAG: uracil-DNA glycosylase [Candidatus Hodarchaeota archaeon]